jgi:hypothetical protein
MTQSGEHETVRPNRLLERAGENIRHLIHHRNNTVQGEMLVYTDRVLDLEWECDDQAERVLEGRRNEFAKIQNGVAELEPLVHNWPPDLKLSVKRLLGEAIARGLMSDTQEAKQALALAKGFIKSKSQQVSRAWTLEACLFTGAAMLIVGLIEISLRPWFETALTRLPYLLSLCFCAGCVGAVLFVILKLGNEKPVDTTAERHLHILEGVSRVVAGGISGVLVGAMIKLGLFLPVFLHTGNEGLAMCVAAMVSGASERLAAGIITSVGKNSVSPKEQEHADN